MKLNDKVVFYIPPTADEAELAERKGKHMPQYRGPAVITKVYTPTTFQLQHNGRTYQRCLSELRPYKVKGESTLDVGVAPDSATSFDVGAFVTYRDTDDPDSDDSKRFHLGKVINVADGEAHLHCQVTKGKALSHAKWSPLYQRNNGEYTLADSKHSEPVVDRVPVDELEWVLHYDVQLTKDIRITKKSRRQLERKTIKYQDKTRHPKIFQASPRF